MLVAVAVAVIGVVGLLGGCCCYNLAAPTPPNPPLEITGYELLDMLQSQFPGLQPGPCGILVAKNEFHVYELTDMTQLINQARQEANLPECLYDRTVVILAELKKADQFIAAGMVMIQGSPPWALLFLATERGQMAFYIYNSKSGEIQRLMVRAGIELVIF